MCQQYQTTMSTNQQHLSFEQGQQRQPPQRCGRVASMTPQNFSSQGGKSNTQYSSAPMAPIEFKSRPQQQQHLPLASMELHNHNEQRHTASNAQLQYEPARVAEYKQPIGVSCKTDSYLMKAQEQDFLHDDWRQSFCTQSSFWAPEQQQQQASYVQEQQRQQQQVICYEPALLVQHMDCVTTGATGRQQALGVRRQRVSSVSAAMHESFAATASAATTLEGPSEHFPITRSVSFSSARPANFSFEQQQQQVGETAVAAQKQQFYGIPQQQQQYLSPCRGPCASSSLSSGCSSIGSPAQSASQHSFNLSPRSTPTSSPQPTLIATSSTRLTTTALCSFAGAPQQQQQQQQQQLHRHRSSPLEQQQHYNNDNTFGFGINLEQYISKRNERERSRVRNVNDAFDNLKNSLPLGVDKLTKRMSKVEILRTAISYIRNLEEVLGYKEQSHLQEQRLYRSGRLMGGEHSGRQLHYAHHHLQRHLLTSGDPKRRNSTAAATAADFLQRDQYLQPIKRLDSCELQLARHNLLQQHQQDGNSTMIRNSNLLDLDKGFGRLENESGEYQAQQQQQLTCKPND